MKYPIEYPTTHENMECTCGSDESPCRKCHYSSLHILCERDLMVHISFQLEELKAKQIPEGYIHRDTVKPLLEVLDESGDTLAFSHDGGVAEATDDLEVEKMCHIYVEDWKARRDSALTLYRTTNPEP